jgi:hypothetical protein
MPEICREELLKSLRIFRYRRCPIAGIGDISCDCEPGVEYTYRLNSTKTGCPEIKKCIDIISVITAAEFEQLEQRISDIKKDTQMYGNNSLLRKIARLKQNYIMSFAKMPTELYIPFRLRDELYTIVENLNDPTDEQLTEFCNKIHEGGTSLLGLEIHISKDRFAVDHMDNL